MKKGLFIFIGLLFLIFGCATGEESSYKTIDIDGVQQLQDDGAVVLDVREVDEFAEGHIIGAINHPLSVLREGDFSGLNKVDSYVVICRSGNRSIEASDILFKEKFDIVNVSTGMTSWTGEVE